MTISINGHRKALCMLNVLHGTVALIDYAARHDLTCGPCHQCGWTPHVEGECLICGSIDENQIYGR